MNEHTTNSQGGSYLAVLERAGDATIAHLCCEVAVDGSHLVLMGSWPLATAPRVPHGATVRVCPVYLDGSYSWAEWCEGRDYTPA